MGAGEVVLSCQYQDCGIEICEAIAVMRDRDRDMYEEIEEGVLTK